MAGSCLVTLLGGALCDVSPPSRLVDEPARANAEPSLLQLTPPLLTKALVKHSLLFVLFHASSEAESSYLFSNFSYAADELARQKVAVGLGKLQIEWGDASTVALARRVGVTELPDIKIFHFGRPRDYQAGADALDLIDVARWNAGALMQRLPTSKVFEIEGADGLQDALARHQLLLVAFTTRWCSRCLKLASEFDQASTLLSAADPPVALATLNLDVPVNAALAERFGVYSFPIGKYFFRKRFIGAFTGGSHAHEIVSEMLTIRNNLLNADKDERDGKEEL